MKRASATFILMLLLVERSFQNSSNQDSGLNIKSDFYFCFFFKSIIFLFCLIFNFIYSLFF